MSNRKFSPERAKDLTEVSLLAAFLGADALSAIGLVRVSTKTPVTPDDATLVLAANAFAVSLATKLFFAYLILIAIVLVIWVIEQADDPSNLDSVKQAMREHRGEGFALTLGVILNAAMVAIANGSDSPAMAIMALIVMFTMAAHTLVLIAINVGPLVTEEA